MRIVILPTPESVGQRAADVFCQVLHRKPDAVLGLATGGTPLPTYKELVRRYEVGEVSFAECTTFNLDEYVGLPEDHPQSYRTFMQENLFSKTDLRADYCYLPDASGNDLNRASETYEAALKAAGGIDLQLLGLGSDGHIAFNEPGSSLASRTRPKGLTEQTRRDNARFFDDLEDVPKLALTMGIGTILDAREILLLATGANKANAVRDFVEGPITASIPASALQQHRRVTVLLDEAASEQLQRKDYYGEMEALQREIEAQSNTHHDTSR